MTLNANLPMRSEILVNLLCFFFPLLTPQNGLVGSNPINTERNGSPAVDGRLGSHSDFFRCPYGQPTACGWCQIVPKALAGNRICVGVELTQLVKVCVAAVGPRN